jgi:hypothetical protein
VDEQNEGADTEANVSQMKSESLSICDEINEGTKAEVPKVYKVYKLQRNVTAKLPPIQVVNVEVRKVVNKSPTN